MRLAAFLCLPILAFADDYELSVRAYGVLQKNCFTCHGPAKTSGLDLRTGPSAMAGGAHGPAIVASQPDESPLYRMASHAIKPFMPPGGKLSEADLDTLREWIAAGASFAGFEEAAPVRDSVNNVPERPITPAERSYWAFQPPKRAAVTGNGNPIDAFLVTSMRAKGLTPAPRADRRTLIRRAYLDLTGLPPAP